MSIIKLPNGYGTIYKLSGKRRKPWIARKTVGWDGGKQLIKTIGTYPTKAEALQALADYNQNPYSFAPSISFSAVYEKWSDEKFDTISPSNVNGYKASYKVCEQLYDIQFSDIRKSHMQSVVDTSGKNYPTLRKLKVLFNQMYQFALENDICQKDYSKFVDITKHKKKGDSDKHKPFTESEIQLLWDSVGRNEYIEIFLMLIYSGVRIGELLDLKKSDVHIEQRYFDITSSKTEAGVRKVPIAKKTLHFFEHWMSKSPCEYLLCTPDNKHLQYSNYKEAYWHPLMTELHLDHLPHDTRHTCISMLAKAGVNQTIIKRIAGHSGAMSLTEKVYTHFDIEQLTEAIDTI